MTITGKRRMLAWTLIFAIFSLVVISCVPAISYDNHVIITPTDVTPTDAVSESAVTSSSSVITTSVTTTTITTEPTTTTTHKPTTTTTKTSVLQKGMSGSEVTALQKRLKELGYFKVDVTGYFGNNTLAAVKSFQRTANLTVDGVVGPQTKAKLFSSDAPKAPKTTTKTTEHTTVHLNENTNPTSSNGLRSLGTFTLTAYCPCSKCCGKWANGITSTGTTAKAGRTIAVDPTVIPYGTVVVINGHEYVAEDCGGAIKSKKIDIFFNTHQEALNFGRQKAEVFIKVEE